jgi:hypothetical protein
MNVIPRATERILGQNEALDDNNWLGLEYLAFESNSLLTGIEVDQLFSGSSLRLIFIPALVPRINGLELFGPKISMISVDEENQYMTVRDCSLMDSDCISILRYYGFELAHTLDAPMKSSAMDFSLNANRFHRLHSNRIQG